MTAKKQNENKLDFKMANHRANLNYYAKLAEDIDPEIIRQRREKLNGIRDREILDLEEKLGIDDQPIHPKWKSTGVFGTTAYNAFQGPTIRSEIWDND